MGTEDIRIFIDDYNPIDYTAEYPAKVAKLFSRQMNSTVNPVLKRLRPEFGWIYRLARDSRITDIRFDIKHAKKWQYFTLKVSDHLGRLHWQSCRKRDFCVYKGYIILRHTEPASDRFMGSYNEGWNAVKGFTREDACYSQIFEVAPEVYEAIRTYRLFLKI